jgi:biopolymer transport protein ExbD
MQGDVELNLAAMLDMAFQLLTFFILTFKPAPIEGQISLRLPPPVPINLNKGQAAGADTKNNNAIQGVNSLIISVFPDNAGNIDSLAIGELNAGSLSSLDAKLKTMFADPGNPFEQVIIQVGAKLHYSELMKVIDICSHQTLPDGKTRLSKLSFVEMPSVNQ